MGTDGRIVVVKDTFALIKLLPVGRMDLFAGLSLIFLSLSGLIMYVDLLRRRRRGGRKQLFWT